MLRQPSDRDGRPVSELVARCPPLDTNSLYASLLQCTHFSDTSVVAEDENGKPAGFIPAYRLPSLPHTLFVWQVAVDPQARGLGVGLSMLESLLERLLPHGVRFLETTISPKNAASQALFLKLFSRYRVAFTTRLLFSGDDHFGGKHDDEELYHAGPFLNRARGKNRRNHENI
ncbi:MAG: diaminobutyrate acetyltransferase [Leptospirillum sp.]